MANERRVVGCRSRGVIVIMIRPKNDQSKNSHGIGLFRLVGGLQHRCNQLKTSPPCPGPQRDLVKVNKRRVVGGRLGVIMIMIQPKNDQSVNSCSIGAVRLIRRLQRRWRQLKSDLRVQGPTTGPSRPRTEILWILDIWNFGHLDIRYLCFLRCVDTLMIEMFKLFQIEYFILID